MAADRYDSSACSSHHSLIALCRVTHSGCLQRLEVPGEGVAFSEFEVLLRLSLSAKLPENREDDGLSAPARLATRAGGVAVAACLLRTTLNEPVDMSDR